MAAISSNFEQTIQAMRPALSAVPVLALGGGLTLTGVIRILGRDKLPLYGVCDNGDCVQHSRWYCAPPLRAENLAPDHLETFLRFFPLERAVLMPCTDDWLRAVTALPDSLSRRFPASIGPPSVVHTMVDKSRFAQLLDSTGTPHPETMLVTSREHLESLSSQCFNGKIIKPLSSVEFARKHGVKGYLVRNQAEALRSSVNIDFPILLQDFIPGPPTANFFVDGFVDQHGQICARFARQRLRMYPPNLGNSSLLISVPLSGIAEAVKALDRLLSSVPYRGIFSAEFKYDRRDGHFKILEINARPWWYVEFAARCGVDLCRLAYRDALDLPVQPIRDYQVGRRCVYLPNDLRAYLDLRRDDHVSFWSWAQSWAGADGALLAWDDPRPAVTYLRGAVGRALHRIGRRKRSNGNASLQAS